MILERISASEAAAGGIFASFNASYFAREALRSPQRARRAAASVLTLLHAALAAEAALYLAFLPEITSRGEAASLAIVRGVLALAVAAITLLVLRLALSRGVRP